MIFFPDQNYCKYNYEKIDFLFKIILIEIMTSDSISFMSKNLNSNNSQNSDLNFNNEESDYKNIITINGTIAC